MPNPLQDYTNEWIRLEDYKCSGGGPGSLDPFAPLFSQPWDKTLPKMLKDAEKAQAAAQGKLLHDRHLSAPMDQMVGHHSGLFGPALPDVSRKSAAKRLTKAVRGFTRARQVRH